MANTERTFIMVKPDGVQRGIVGEIIQRFEKKGFKLVGLKFLWPSEELLQKHYSDLSSKPFFPGLVKYMSSGPVVPMVWEGLNVVKTGRQMLGATNPADSLPGTIRGDLWGKRNVHPGIAKPRNDCPRIVEPENERPKYFGFSFRGSTKFVDRRNDMPDNEKPNMFAVFVTHTHIQT